MMSKTTPSRVRMSLMDESPWRWTSDRRIRWLRASRQFNQIQPRLIMGGPIAFSSWPGFVPAIYVFLAYRQDVEARQRRQVYGVCARQTTMAGHDDLTTQSCHEIVPNHRGRFGAGSQRT